MSRAQVNNARMRRREVSKWRNARAVLELLSPLPQGIRYERAPDVIHHSPTVYAAACVTWSPRRQPGSPLPLLAPEKDSARPLVQPTRTVTGIVACRARLVNLHTPRQTVRTDPPP